MILEPSRLYRYSTRIHDLRRMMDIHVKDLIADAIAEGWDRHEVISAVKQSLELCDFPTDVIHNASATPRLAIPPRLKIDSLADHLGLVVDKSTAPILCSAVQVMARMIDRTVRTADERLE